MQILYGTIQIKLIAILTILDFRSNPRFIQINKQSSMGAELVIS